MRFRNGKKKVGLIALLSCVLTATVAFAAYTGYNYINGTVDVLAAPVEMVFADKDGNEVPTISEADHAEITGYATASDLTVTTNDEGMQTIDNLHVGLSDDGDMVTYTFNVKNNGLGTAYLTGLEIGNWDLPTGVEGVDYEVYVDNGYARSVDGATVSAFDPGSDTSVDAGGAAVVRIIVSANGFTVDPGFGRTANENDFTLGQITMTWMDTDPNAE